MTTQFVELLAARDFDGLTSMLAPNTLARFLLPHGLEEYAGREAVAHRMKDWFGAASKLNLVDTSDNRIGSRRRMTWTFDVVRDGREEVIEQVVFVDETPDGISQIDLLCSGFLPQQAEAVSCEARIFDAGSMGCADGLADEFRNRLTEVPVGGHLAVVVRDPAAKEDLPSLARMLGQRITSSEATADGRLIITVEKKK
jgi:TusA-related sulfurtransferase